MGTSIGINELKKRVRIMVDGEPWEIVGCDMVKPGKGQAFTRVKIKNLISGRVIERTYKSSESVETADVTYTTLQFLYHDGDEYTFMDPKNYEQVAVNKEIIEESAHWLLDNTDCEVGFWGPRVISVVPPAQMEYAITEAEPAVRGDTATNATKKAVIETGYEIDVPMFVKLGDKVKIDTRTGAYLGRS